MNPCRGGREGRDGGGGGGGEGGGTGKVWDGWQRSAETSFFHMDESSVLLHVERRTYAGVLRQQEHRPDTHLHTCEHLIAAVDEGRVRREGESVTSRLTRLRVRCSL